MCTDTVFLDSDPELRAWRIGVTDFCNISHALSPEPTVKANNPTKRAKHIANSFQRSKKCKSKQERVKTNQWHEMPELFLRLTLFLYN